METYIEIDLYNGLIRKIELTNAYYLDDLEKDF